MKTLDIKRLTGAILLALSCAVITACGPDKPQPGAVTATQSSEYIRVVGDRLTIIDVRTPEEFAQGHIAQAKNIPSDTLQSRLAELPSGPILLVCRSGNRAEKAWQLIMSRQPERKNLRYLKATLKYQLDGTYTIE